MTTINDLNPDGNPRLHEIYEILLLAGYFRIRIASLKAFDKVIGGIAWCITSSNFEIEVQYNDEMQIGQKIRVSEKICESLLTMKCPCSLQPFQLQGLDLNNIFPIVQWLVKFVYETRQERQMLDRELSVLLGRNIIRIDNMGNPEKIPKQQIKRTRINRVIQKSKKLHPLRVYSALLEFNDLTGSEMYNKLLNILANRKKDNSKQQQEQKQMLQLIREQQEQNNPSEDLNSFGTVDKLSLQRLQRIMDANMSEFEKGFKEDASPGAKNLESLRQNLGISGEQLQLLAQQQNEEQSILRQAKLVNDKLIQKIETLEKQLESYQSIEQQLQGETSMIQKKLDKTRQVANEQESKNEQYKEITKQIEQQLKTREIKQSSGLQQLIEKRQQLKKIKTQIKKKAKARIEELTYQKEMVEATLPEIDEEAFTHMIKEAELKKQIYDRNYEELTLVNQQLAILQRKAENYTSPSEIAQYHQRFVELFEGINVLIEEKRSMFSELSNLEGSKKMVRNYVEILNNFKQNYNYIKKKKQLRELIEEQGQTVKGLQENMRKSKYALAQMQSKRESAYGQLMDLIKQERQYFALLRNLKLEYENSSKYYE